MAHSTTTTHHHTPDGLIERTEHHTGPHAGYIVWRLNGEKISVDTAADALARALPCGHTPPIRGGNSASVKSGPMMAACGACDPASNKAEAEQAAVEHARRLHGYTPSDDTRPAPSVGETS